jgi:hypothetical protein
VVVVDGPVDRVNEVAVEPGAETVIVLVPPELDVTVVVEDNDEESSTTPTIPTTTTTIRTAIAAGSPMAGRRVLI